jgi:hypothetical protein
MTPEPVRVLSLGVGVQSSTLYLMAVHGEFGHRRPVAAIFADTQWEPAGVYNWLRELERIGGREVPIRQVTAGNIRAALLEANRTYRRVSAPFYVKAAVGREGVLYRQCTKHFKLEPIRRATRELLGIAKGARVPKETAVECWIGISVDEAVRMKEARESWITHRWPLIERGMTRRDCVKWLAQHGYPEPPKSACIACPYTNDARWHEMKSDRPEEFADAVAFDEQIRRGLPAVTGEVFVHRSCLPLAEVDFSTDEERGQINLFESECEGLCGV